VTVSHEGKALLRLDRVKKHFLVRGAFPWSLPKGNIRAVDGVSLEVQAHQTLSLVGESGCGKTTTSKLVLRLEEPTSGSITFEGREVHHLQGDGLSQYRASVQAVFQDPWGSLNPRLRIWDTIAEPLVVNLRLTRTELQQRVSEMLGAVGLEPAAASNYPHEFSGGQRQRIAVARALTLRPSLIILDEPVSALDVSIRAQIMNLLKDLQQRFGMAYLLIAHDLATVRYLSHRVAVMYMGQIVEEADSEELFSKSMHPYTNALISAAMPARPGEARTDIVLAGDVPSPVNPPSGCRFHPRCPLAFGRCPEEAPVLREMANGHRVACHLY
jgi:oligopeptide/dipeptide ABC transporter ATP-binding protein